MAARTKGAPDPAWKPDPVVSHWAMRQALDQAAYAARTGQLPFGACVIRGVELIGTGHNTVLTDQDVSGHAEINALRAACAKTDEIDLHGCVLYTSCEPCPMCLTACYWARVSGIVYAAKAADATQAGFRQLPNAPAHLSILATAGTRLAGGLMRDEGCRILTNWSATANWSGHQGAYQNDALRQRDSRTAE
ncbi:nucleoside deaminase [Streptomyces chartreusis]|uniref:nucleoside deaminase n=1 Tax=Streptomyces chartreusis TaxID=1969 RepID=UPI00382A3C00